MALDKIRLLVNKIRRLSDSNESGENDVKLDNLYTELDDAIDQTNSTIKIVVTTEIEVRIKDVDKEWLTDALVDSETDESIQEIIIGDILSGDGPDYYYENFDSTRNIKIYDENGKKLAI